MATSGKIGKLSARIEALAGQRRGKLRLEDITDETHERLDKLVSQESGGKPRDMRERTGLEHWSTDALINRLIELGTLTAADLKRPI